VVVHTCDESRHVQGHKYEDQSLRLLWAKKKKKKLATLPEKKQKANVTKILKF
jgi:hypothetical protein